MAPETGAYDVMFLLAIDNGGYDLPEILVGFAASQDDSKVTVFGVVPSGATEVELLMSGIVSPGDPLTIERIFDRPQVDRAVFIGVIDESDFLLMTPDSREEAVAVVIEVVPEVIACDGSEDGGTTPPNKGGPVTDAGTHASPAEALEAFVAELFSDPPIATSGYTEMSMPDGSIVYGINHDGNFVTLITVIPVGNGWTVDAWEASGC